jgi:hypothetical protein
MVNMKTHKMRIGAMFFALLLLPAFVFANFAENQNMLQMDVSNMTSSGATSVVMSKDMMTSHDDHHDHEKINHSGACCDIQCSPTVIAMTMAMAAFVQSTTFEPSPASELVTISYHPPERPPKFC